MADFPFWAAVRSVKEGMSGSAGLRAYRAGGGKIGTQTWHRMVAEARHSISARGDEVSRPLNRRPTADETTTWTTAKAKGWIQQVEVMVRDRDTGDILTIPFSLKGRTLVSRQSAIDDALSVITPEGTDGEKQQILGAVYVGTYEMRPGGG